MRRGDRYRLERMAELGDLLLATIAEEGITTESLQGDYRQQWLVSTPLHSIGERARCISSELKEAHPEIERGGVSSLRHRLAHDREGTNWAIIASAVADELPAPARGVRAVLSEMGAGAEGR